MKKTVFRALQTARSAHYGLPAKLAEIASRAAAFGDVGGTLRQIFRIEIEILRNENIEPPVAVVIAECRAG